MLGTGIRVSECNGLDLSDIDLVVNTLTIVRKGGGQDVLYFGDDVHKVLQDYIDTERKNISPVSGHEKALFFSLQGKRISVDAIEKLVKKYAGIAVPNKKITPHKLRSTYGTALYRETGDIRLVADVLGHENVNTTIDYYAAIEDEHKKMAANAVDFKRPDQ
jgi:site-specific recombinase XerD